MKIPFDVNNEAGRKKFLYEQVPLLIDAINSTQPASWGQFTAQHMLEHLIWAFEASVGKISHPLSIPEDRVPRYKQFLFNDMPTQHEFRNPLLGDTPPTLRYGGLEEAKQELKVLLSEFRDSPDNSYMHSLFGSLNHEEWERMHYKHCYHHFLQFGLIDEYTPV